MQIKETIGVSFAGSVESSPPRMLSCSWTAPASCLECSVRSAQGSKRLQWR